MEPFTQALLGAATAELAAGRKLGRRALGWGAVIGLSPDLDVLLAPLRNGYGEWLYHRGTTHSLWFGFVVGPLLGWALWRWRDPDRETPLRAWVSLCVVALVTHPILDGFTPYGTQFFAPFWRARFAWNGVAIVDPFFSIILATGVALAASRRLPFARRRLAVLISLGAGSVYLLFGLAINQWVVNDLRVALAPNTTGITRIRAYPTILQPWLRSFVVQSETSLLVGLHTLMDPGCPSWREYARPEPSSAIDTVMATWEAKLLEWFADEDIGIFVDEGARETIVRVEDLRYSWSTANARGMWGIEARIDRDGQLRGPVRRLARPPLDPGSLARFRAMVAGHLPGAAEHWKRPSHCAGASS